MKDEHKTKKQLIEELVELRNAFSELKKSEKPHKKIKESLLVSEERYRNIFNTVPIAIWEYDFKDLLDIFENIHAQGITDIEEYFSQKPEKLKEFFSKLYLIDVNDEALRMYGATTREEMFSQKGTHHTPESLGSFRESIKAYFEGKTYHESFSVNETLDGRQIQVIIRIAFPERGQLSNRVLVTVSDITEQSQSISALKESEERYRSLFEMSVDPIGITTHDGEIIHVNPAWLNLLGYKSEKITGSNIRMIYANPDDRDRFISEIDKRGYVRDYEMKLRKKGGTVIDCLLNSNMRMAEDGSIAGYQSVIRDMTERKQLEEERIKASKIESLGILAGGIAHDFNNILTSILGNISLSQEFLNEDKGKEILLKAQNACVQAKNLTNQLLTFSKGGAPVKEIASVSEIIKESASFSLIGSNVVCEFSIPDDLWQVEIDKGQIIEVINNLIINAAQAMPEGGKIVIRAQNTTIGEKSAIPLKKGDYVTISINDNGTGIHPDHLPKIFDPYFTTKEGGSGLGLAITFSIIKRHGGHIKVHSQLGTGTTFTLYIPASFKENGKKEKKEKKPARLKGNILVMDDNEGIRDLAHEALTFFGYNVEVACDGAEALKIFVAAYECNKPFDVIILDLTVPGGTGGKEVIQRFLEIDPATKAIVSSGYSNDPVMSNYKDYGFKGVLTKPYNPNDLMEVIDTVLREC